MLKKILNKRWWQVQRNELRIKRSVSNPQTLTAEQMHDWVNYVPIEPRVRLWLRIKPRLVKVTQDVVTLALAVAFCYAGFRALDYRAIEDGCLRYEANPMAANQMWEKVCED